MDAPYFQFYPNDFLADTHWLTTQEVGAYIRLMCDAWKELPAGTLPDDDAILSRKAGLDAATWQEVKPAVMSFFKLGADGRWNHIPLRTAFERYRQKSRAAQESVSHRKDRDINERRTDVDRTLNERSTNQKSEDRSRDTIVSPAVAAEGEPEILPESPPPKPGKKAKTKNADKGPPAPPWMSVAFEKAFETHYGTKFARQTKDYVQLHIAYRAQNGGITEEDWGQALANYFATPQGAHTMADLAVHYTTFRRSALDRFKQPVMLPGAIPMQEEFTDGASLRREIEELARRESEARNSEKDADSLAGEGKSLRTPVASGKGINGVGHLDDGNGIHTGREMANALFASSPIKRSADVRQATDAGRSPVRVEENESGDGVVVPF